MEELYLPKIQPPEGRIPVGVDASSTINRAGNMYNQLETMMSAVRQEALALDAMKQKLAEMEDLKLMVPELKTQLAETEGKKTELERALRDSDKLYQQLRNEMQKLNDLYNTERRQHLESQNANMQLDGEVSRLQQEVSFLQREADKMSEMRKKIQSMQQQLNLSEESVEEVKKAAQRNLLAMKKKLDDAEMEKTAHLAILSRTSDDLDAARVDIKRLQEEKMNIQHSMHSSVEQAFQEVESMRRRVDESMAREEKQAEESSAMQSELRKLRELVSSKTESIDALQQKVRTFDEARQQDRNENRMKIAELNDTISMLKSENHMLERQSADAIHKLGLFGGDVARFQGECERLRSDIEQKESVWAQKETLVAQHMQSLAQSKDEAIARSVAATAQIDSLQNQLRDLQSNHWENLQRTKESDAQIAEETDALQQELHEKALQVIALEAEKSKLEEYVNAEVLNASQLSTTLRSELEKRIEELTQTRKERDLLISEKASLQEKVNECDNVIKRNDALFKKTLESDRQKIQQEVRTKLTRLKALETDKQELLNETNELVSQLTDAKRESTSLQQQLLDLKRAHEELTGSYDAAQSTRAVLDKRLVDAGKKENDLKEALMQLENKYRVDAERHEMALKDSKKETAHQILDMSAQVKYLTGELESLQGRTKDLDTSEKKAWAEADRLRGEVDSIVRNHDKSQSQLAEEFAVLKRDNRELRIKVSLMTESKGKTDIEIMNLQVEMTKSENEIGKLTDLLKESEFRVQSAEDNAKKCKAEMDVIQEQYGRCKLRNVELEESMTKKTKLIEKQTKDISKLEREGVSEVKRLRLLLTTAEREVVELKPMVASLQKEVSDGRSNFVKLQNSTNSTVCGLLEELRSTEDALALERKRCTMEVENYHTKMVELQNSLDRTREHLEEHTNRTKTDRNDKEMRLLQVERENERLRDGITSRDGRISELEKQKQSDRLKLHEMRDKVDSTERDLVDAKANIELEQTQRKLLDSRVRQLEEQLRITREQQFSNPSRSDGNIFGGGDEYRNESISGKKVRSQNETPENSDNENEEGGAVLSPIDRVSAALASRAAAESNKLALKQAQQSRIQRSNSSTVASVSSLVAPAAPVVVSSLRPLPADLLNKSNADRLIVDDDEDEEDEDEEAPTGKDHRTEDKYPSLSNVTSNQTSPQQEQLLMQKKLQSRELPGEKKPMTVEDSISKTQSFLQRRLAAQARMASLQQNASTKQEDEETVSQSGDDNIKLDSPINNTKNPANAGDKSQSYLQAAISASMLASAAFEKQMSKGFVNSSQTDSPGSKRTVGSNSRGNINANDDDDGERMEYDGDVGANMVTPGFYPSGPSNGDLGEYSASLNEDDMAGDEMDDMQTSNLVPRQKKKKGKKGKKVASSGDNPMEGDIIKTSGESGFLPKINVNMKASGKR